MNTPVPKGSDIKESWYLVDATNMVPGRIASRIARRLQGKDSTQFTPYALPAVHVVIVNAGKVFLAQSKEEQPYYYHTGYTGGIRQESWLRTLEGKHPERFLTRMIKCMMPKHSPRARRIMECLHVYKESSHPHAAQNPVEWDLGNTNRKNVRTDVV